MSSKIFDGCCIAFVPTPDLIPKRISELATVVRNNGGEVSEPEEDGTIPVHDATHIISNTINFPQYTEAQARMVPVVNENWIIMSLTRSKTIPVRPYSPDTRLIFANVVITCVGLPIMDKESIIGATMALGGMESPEISRTTTHICALTGEEPACVAAMAKGCKAKIVLPHWFDDCFKLGKRIKEDPYLLPDAEILKSSHDESVEIPASNHLEGAMTAMPKYLPPHDQNSERPPLSVFSRKKVRLAADLQLRPGLVSTLNGIITDSSGSVVDSVDECDMLICHFREGDEYVKAASEAKDVGNLSWLFHLITTDTWSSPLHRLLHYPLPKEGIPGFKGLKITVSNYGGEARTYLENLIKAAGATFTKTMRTENTHLITARRSGEKCEAAIDWDISMVNHLWIEESYAKCAMQPLTGQRYNHFPQRTNLGEVIGQTFFDETKLREAFYPVDDKDLPEEARRRRLILEAAQENAYNYGPAEGVAIGREDVKVWREKAKREVKSMAGSAKKSHVSTGKENDVPFEALVTRSAKKQATATLQLLVNDIEQYQKENKRRSKDGRGPWGGKRAADELEKVAQQPSKKAKTSRESSKQGVVKETKKSKSVKPKLEKPYNITILVTGYERWVSDPKKEERDRIKLGDFGIKLVQETASCQYLAAPKIMRTMKFILGLSRGAEIISTEFLDHVLTTGEAADPEDFILVDSAYEKTRSFKLSQALSRSRQNAGKLLSEMPIYCTMHVKHGVKTFEALAKANNAIFKTYDGKHNTIKKTTAEEDGGNPPDPVYLISSNTSVERELYPKFRQMAEEGHCEPRIVAPDWILEVVMRQEVMYDERFAVESWYASR